MNANSSCEKTPSSTRAGANDMNRPSRPSATASIAESQGVALADPATPRTDGPRSTARVEAVPMPPSANDASLEAPFSASHIGLTPVALAELPIEPTPKRANIFRRISNLAPGLTSKLNLVADCVLVIAASVISTDRGAWHHTALIAFIALTVWVLGARVIRHYNAWSEGLFAELAVTSVLIVTVAVALQVLNKVVPGDVGNTGVGSFLLLTWPGVWFVRATVVAVRAWRQSPPEQVLIVGTGPLGRVTGEDIRDTNKRRYLSGYLGWKEEAKSRRLPAPVLGKWEELENQLKQNAIAEVYIAGNPAKNGEAMQSVIRTCERFGVPFALPAYGFRLSRARPVNGRGFRDGYVHFLNIEHKPVQMVVKRLFDIAASAFALWVLSPLLVATAIAIKVTSRGPVFFKQERVGMHGRTFSMLKFRSMVANAEELKLKLMAMNEQNGPVFKIQKDPRITAVGRFIRKFSIDEIPQLINVVRGEMSVVGPRPPLPSEVALYEPWQRRRLSVRPGLTCLWQVSGRNNIGFQDWMYLDMQYIDHWSLGQDFNLILKTVPVVLTGRGAS
jgi:exopolysaccharide biosynthesis polyprenyl glycosylphosphotransferase